MHHIEPSSWTTDAEANPTRIRVYGNAFYAGSQFSAGVQFGNFGDQSRINDLLPIVGTVVRGVQHGDWDGGVIDPLNTETFEYIEFQLPSGWGKDREINVGVFPSDLSLEDARFYASFS